MPEKRSISFRSSKDSTSIARSSIHIRSVVSGIVWSILIGIYSQQKKNIYVVLGLGSTDDVLLTSICLRKPHLEHKKKRSCLPHVQEIYIYIYICFFRLRFYGPCFLICTHLLGETTRRTYIKPKLFATYAREKVNFLSFFQRQYFYCTFQYTYTECCFGDCLEYIDRYLFPAKEKYFCCFRPRFFGRCSFDQHLLEEATLRT